MRGKIVNVCVGCMNIAFGIFLLIYTMYIPQEITELTVQELSVTKTVLKISYLILIFIVVMDIFQYQNNKDNNKMKTGYLIGLFMVSFFLIKEPAIAIIPIISGLIISIAACQDRVVEIDSTTGISIIALMIMAIVILIGVSLGYEKIGESIKNKENKGNQAYTSDYFKYVTELDIEEPYINVKKNGKYGYINPSGDVVMDFVYDYASPFVNITAYNKDFQVALVCQEGTSYVILKNQRKVMSYRSESSDENYEAKRKELEDIYKNTLGQGGQMETEIKKRTDSMQRAPRYEEISHEYTYRYDYNNEYDILVTETNFGEINRFELAKKDNLEIRIPLDCTNIDYDENQVYLYSNFTIPYFDISAKKQGWFTSYGMKNEMTGNAQILDLFEDKILMRNYNKNSSIYFIDSQKNKLTENYKDIYITEERYIVKNEHDKYMVIDKNFEKVFDQEFDVIDPYLVEHGLYICADTNEAIDFNDYNFAKMNWKLVNYDGQTILEGIEQIYGNYYQISNEKSVPYVTRYEEFLKKLTDIEFHFVGDKFYKSYQNEK